MAAPPNTGFAEFAWPDGGKYEGEWKEGKMHGHGRYVESDGSSYSGNWHMGKMQGKGVQIFCRGDRYEGQYHDGQRHGKGKQVFANGNTYDGEFFKGKIQGHGTYTCSDGRVYVGEFLDNKKHGNGKYSGGQGTYAGEYVDGKKHGRGVFTWTDGSMYDGQWADDVMHGTGIRTGTDGKRQHVCYEKGNVSTQVSTLSSSGVKPRVPVRNNTKNKGSVTKSSWGDAAGAGSSEGGSVEWYAPFNGGRGGHTEEEEDFGVDLEDEEENLGPIGMLKKKWDDLSTALNCYGTIENARDYCGPTARTCGLGGK